MPIGLCNAAQRLVLLMDRVIPAELRSNVFVYLDDLLILTPDFQTYLKYLRRVAHSLKSAGLTIGLKKSKFCFKSLTYLGFIVGGGLLRMDPGRVSAIQKMPYPKSMNVALLNAKFVLSPSVPQPVADLDERAGPGSREFQKIFIHPVRRISRWRWRGIVSAEPGCRRATIAFFTAKMNNHQSPLLGHGKGVSASLKWLMTMKDLSGRFARWSLQLQGYDFSTEHRKGSENVVADTLSCIIEEIRIDPSELLGFEMTEFAAEDYTELVQDVVSNKEHLPDQKVEDGIIFKRMSNSKMDEELEAEDPANPCALPDRAGSKAGHGGMMKTFFYSIGQG
ncbi:uncharacterized protein LOC122818936 [Drosophila biarmipes]|uniref:uncharacterized protein LOC122818936 n=1 Tax=Drosophila biarmipes TaxID=125945 RepID=UPI0021CD095B|nr:uncharacterized protein LOC122818936 [Drosophila biarmipes]